MNARRRHMHRLPLLGVALLALGAIGFSSFADPTPRLIWNASASAPIGLYRLDPDAPLALGARVAYRPTPDQARLFAQRHYLPAGLPLLKPVAAVAPSRVCRDGDALSIDGRLVAQARRSDGAGRPLPTWSGCRSLTPETVFLMAAETPDSLDGRYLGPVRRDRILGSVTPLWIREPVR
jgi:conjugative transfer signal peptidase TraF